MRLVWWLVVVGLWATDRCVAQNNCYKCPSFSTSLVDCPQSFADCQCDPAATRNEENETCQCNFLCPDGSQRNTGPACPVTFEDCNCKTGFYRAEDGASCIPCYKCTGFSFKDPSIQCATGFEHCLCMPNSTRNEEKETCKCDYQCPDGSQRNTGSACPVTFEDCSCKSGFYRSADGSACIPCYSCPNFSTKLATCGKSFADCACMDHTTRNETNEVCTCNYICPEGSQRVTTGCPVTFSDCRCKAGFYRTPDGTNCVPCFDCPSFSTQKSGVQCATGFHDCDCMENTDRLDDVGVCKCKYSCPAFAKPLSTLFCPSSFQDCSCNPGYERLAGERCGCPFVCPTNSRTGLLCALSVADCKCDPGFEMRNGACVACDFTCPANSVGVSDCIASLSDCECKEGFVKDSEHGECVVPWNVSDSIVFVSIFVVCGFFWILATGATKCTKKKFVALVPLIIAVGDFLTDILFAVDLIREGGEAFAAAAFCVVAFTLVINVLLSCKLVHEFRRQKSDETGMSFAQWMMEEQSSDRILGMYFFLCMFTVESLLIAGSKIFDQKMFSVPFSLKQRRLVIGYAVANNFVEDIPQLIIVIASRFVLEQPWTIVAVLNIAFSAISILYFLVIRLTTLVALRSNWLGDAATSEDPAEAGGNNGTAQQEVPQFDSNNGERSMVFDSQGEASNASFPGYQQRPSREYPSFFTNRGEQTRQPYQSFPPNSYAQGTSDSSSFQFQREAAYPNQSPSQKSDALVYQ